MENKNGQGIFLGVVGVATLIVAIIGATFAFFSAQATTEAGDITGQTLGGEGGVLSLSVEKVWTEPDTASSLDLVPTDLSESSAANITTALTAKCEADNYTACHVYRIIASSDSAIASADLKLTTLTVSSTVKTDWKYALFTATEGKTNDAYDGTFSNVALVSGGNGQFELSSSDPSDDITMTITDIAADTDYVRYLMVFLKDDDTGAQDAPSQNAGDTNDATGTYNGTITLETTGGNKIAATFS